MRIFLDEAISKLLTENVLSSLGKKNILPSDCKVISEAIAKKTGNYISETTLKRLFGFAKRNFNFSTYTLDSIAGYLGYDSWESYYHEHHISNSRTTDITDWNKLRSLCFKHSLYTLQAIQNASGIRFSKTIPRNELTNYIRAFLESKKAIAPIIAPSGYGKSVGLAHTALKLWLNEDPMFKNDICCFINVHQIHNISKHKNSLTEWFTTFLNLESNISLQEIKKNKDNNKLVLIIDGFDERTLSIDKLKLICANIIEFVNYHSEYSWIKIIISVRPSVCIRMLQSFITPSFYNEKVFVDHSYPNEDHLNHSLPLTTDEISLILANFGISQERTENFSEDLINFLKFPHHLDILCGLIKSGNIQFGSEEYLIYKITELSIKHHVWFDYNIALNSGILEYMIDCKNSSEPGDCDVKETFVGRNKENIGLYYQMLDENLLVEEKKLINAMFPILKVDFANKYIEQYFTSWIILKRNNYKISPQLINTVCKSKEYAGRKIAILKWYLLNAFQTDNISSIYKIFEACDLTTADKFELFIFLVYQHIEYDNKHSELLRSLDEQNNLLQFFFESGLFYSYLDHNKENVLSALYKISNDRHHKYSLLSILFMISIWRLNISNAEMWLKEYRQQEKQIPYKLIDFQNQIMKLLLDFTRFKIKSDNLPKLVKTLQENISSFLDESVYNTYFILVLFYHLLLYCEEYKLLTSLSNSIKDEVLDKGKNFNELNKLLNSITSYALLMSNEFGNQEQIIKDKIIPAIIKEESFDKSDLLNTGFSKILIARIHLIHNNFQKAAQSAEIAYNVNRKTKSAYRFLADTVLRDIYRITRMEHAS
ncbi:hypothetical protein ACI6Q2_08910 [Chitinophagaceae bacterium LWZ2-11]